MPFDQAVRLVAGAPDSLPEFVGRERLPFVPDQLRKQLELDRRELDLPLVDHDCLPGEVDL